MNRWMRALCVVMCAGLWACGVGDPSELDEGDQVGLELKGADGGIVSRDAGVPRTDGGIAPADGGVISRDGGSTTTDGGRPLDGGQGADAGRPGPDAGAADAGQPSIRCRLTVDCPTGLICISRLCR